MDRGWLGNINFCQVPTVTVTTPYENVFSHSECCLLLQYSFKCQVYFRYAYAEVVALYFVYCCHGDIHFTKNCILTKFNSWSVSSENLIANEKEKIMFKMTAKYR